MVRLITLLLQVGASSDEAPLVLSVEQLLEHTKHLRGQLARWCNPQGHRAKHKLRLVPRVPRPASETPEFSRSDHILCLQQIWNGLGLDLSHPFEAHTLNGLQCGVGHLLTQGAEHCA
ncbi:hypothetical protein MTO96_036969 [Rhipicephalus appendiculatus]